MSDLHAYVRAHLPDYVGALDRLVRVPSVAAQGRALPEAAALVRELLVEAGGRAELYSRGDAAPVVVGEFEGRSARTLLFYNHYDVQPPDPIDEWTSPPFEPIARDGKLFGRGVADNKGDLVTRLAAIRALRDRLDADACIWEYGDRDARDRLHVLAGCKGICYVELTLEAAAHDLYSSFGAIVDGAATRLAWAVAGLRDASGRVRIPGFYDAVRPPAPSTVAAARRAAFFDEQEFRAFAGVDRLLGGRTGDAAADALLFEPTCTVCGFDAGYTGPGMKTVLPHRARAKIDFRLVPDQDPEQIVALLRAHLDRQGFGDCAITPMSRERAFQTDPSHPFLETVVAAARNTTGRQVLLVPTSAGTGPMHAIGEPLRVPIVSIGTGYWGGNVHAPDEHVRMRDFEETIVMIADLLERFAAQEVACRI